MNQEVKEGVVLQDPPAVSADRPIARRGETTPMQMLAMAVKQGADPEKLAKLMELQERWEKNQARVAFAEAMVAFKAEPINIYKSKSVSYASKSGGAATDYKYADLNAVCEQIISALKKHDISHSWNPSVKEGKVTVSCILRHALGHEESVTLEATPDTSGSKNAIQAIGSTITYLERYTLLAAVGHSVKGQDDDGRGAGGAVEAMSEQQRLDFEAAIDGCSDDISVTNLWKSIIKACEQSKDWDAYSSLKERCANKRHALKAVKK